jgi:hypothetical protein
MYTNWRRTQAHVSDDSIMRDAMTETRNLRIYILHANVSRMYTSHIVTNPPPDAMTTPIALPPHTALTTPNSTTVSPVAPLATHPHPKSESPTLINPIQGGAI